ncbi:hypothetical protein [Psychrobacter aestuarii]|uniref:Uncharacterized protein n=1 Tax=Psychrobacter aestuarii TaxID=556327 RepID=A0ABP3FN69_9GAMM|nr:hypothetical protein [Psychrobacter aestuarii]
MSQLWQEKGLNANLIAKIQPVIEENIEGGQGNQVYTVDSGQAPVTALLADGDFVTESQYSTPFEASNPEARLPNLMGALQSGQANAAFYSFFALNGDPTGAGQIAANILSGVSEATGLSDTVTKVRMGLQEQMMALKDRSNFTKVNSQQIYTSSSSVRISATLVFQAWSDARKEVEDQVENLQAWASATELSAQSLIVSGLQDGFSQAMFPSVIPPLVQLQYGGKTYKPMVIESVSTPIVAPMNNNGDRIALLVPVVLLSRTAWDAKNIRELRQ